MRTIVAQIERHPRKTGENSHIRVVGESIECGAW